MPAIPLSDGSGGLLTNATSILIAYLSYPGDEDARSEFLFRQGVAQALSEHQAPERLLAVEREVLSALQSGVPFGEIKRRTQAAAAGGFIAGGVLAAVLRLRQFHPKHASIRKASWIMQNLSDISRSQVWDLWARFKAVAHFFMALQAPLPGEGTLSTPDELLEILSRAEACLKLAEAGARPILQREQCWFAPADLELPPVTIEWSAPPDEEFMRALRSYRAPRA